MCFQEFLKQTSSCYNAELESVDFRNKYEEARIKINSWVEKQTQDKIKDLVEEGILNNITTLVLVNAIYFKGTWEQQILKSWSEKAHFRLNKLKTQMKTQNFIIFCIFILEMPYEGKELNMLIFLPREILDDSTGLERLEKLLTYEKFMEWTSPEKMDLTKVDVCLPRFQMEEKHNLKKVLTRMGMVDAFDDRKCNFSGKMCENLFLFEATHKSVVEMNEEGIEVAAATEASFCYLRTTAKQYFTADHPFLFFNCHNLNRNILFTGRFCSPCVRIS
uniref:Serpin domain-containing protein n=1 Tax=Oryzias latipes TaxID=8090 RepID=A0A3P9KBZ4_ORYLA